MLGRREYFRIRSTDVIHIDGHGIGEISREQFAQTNPAYLIGLEWMYKSHVDLRRLQALGNVGIWREKVAADGACVLNKHIQFRDVFPNYGGIAARNSIFADVNLATACIQDCGRSLSWSAVSQSYSLQHGHDSQRLLQHFAKAFHRRQPYPQASEGTRAGNYNESVQICFIETLFLQCMGDRRHQLRRIRPAFQGSELQNFETVGIAAAQGYASPPARSVDSDQEQHKVREFQASTKQLSPG
jgi:hypothetical protein